MLGSKNGRSWADWGLQKKEQLKMHFYSTKWITFVFKNILIKFKNLFVRLPKSKFSNSFERSITFLFGTEVQGHGMTFKVCNLGFKKPYFNSAYVVSVPIFSFRTVWCKLATCQTYKYGNIFGKTKQRNLFFLSSTFVLTYLHTTCHSHPSYL